MRENRFSASEHRFLVGEGLSIAYTDYQPESVGSGVPLVYLPGFMRTARDFDRVAPRFAAERRVLTIDTRGRGKAGRANSAANYHFDLLIADTWALLDHLRIQRFVVVGLALGAFMAWRLGAERPDRVAGIVANDTGTETSSPGSKKMVGNADHSRYTLDGAAEKLRAPNAHLFPDFGPEDWRDYALQVYADRGEGYIRDFDPLWFEELPRFKAETPTFWPEFERLTCPVAVLHGEMSEYLSGDHAEKMAAFLPKGRVVHVQGRGHPLLLDEPASLAAIRNVLADADQT